MLECSYVAQPGTHGRPVGGPGGGKVRSLHCVMMSAPLPDHLTILRRTDWASLEQPFPDHIVVADELVRLLDDDPEVRVKALNALSEAANHQNTIYEVTPSVARYLAALLVDQRTEAMGLFRRNKPLVSLRVALVDWLGYMANDASDEAAAGAARFGFGVSPAMAEFRRDQRPHAVSPGRPTRPRSGRGLAAAGRTRHVRLHSPRGRLQPAS